MKTLEAVAPGGRRLTPSFGPFRAHCWGQPKSVPKKRISPESMFLTGTAACMFGPLPARSPVRLCLTGGKPAETKPCKKDRLRVAAGVRVVPPQGRGGQGPPPGACISDTLEPILQWPPHRSPQNSPTWLFMRQVVALGIEAGFRITTASK